MSIVIDKNVPKKCVSAANNITIIDTCKSTPTINFNNVIISNDAHVVYNQNIGCISIFKKFKSTKIHLTNNKNYVHVYKKNKELKIMIEEDTSNVNKSITYPHLYIKTDSTYINDIFVKIKCKLDKDTDIVISRNRYASIEKSIEETSKLYNRIKFKMIILNFKYIEWDKLYLCLDGEVYETKYLKPQYMMLYNNIKTDRYSYIALDDIILNGFVVEKDEMIILDKTNNNKQKDNIATFINNYNEIIKNKTKIDKEEFDVMNHLYCDISKQKNFDESSYVYMNNKDLFTFDSCVICNMMKTLNKMSMS